MRKLSLISACVAALTLSACAQPTNDPYYNGPRTGAFGMGTKQTIGTLAGAGAGAWLGSNIGGGRGAIVGTALGTLLGGALGNQVGASMDRADMMYYDRTSQNALESGRTGQAITWRNPDSGNYGTITPTRTYETASGQYCREYTQKVIINGKSTTGYGHACRQPDGTWRIVE